ncbi:hypothetical protein CVIRNUC_007824 [Coccomyxa viridis]|uniref:TLC domain-containing protein n=1 Tax=Coccomyxa viridis TaxID=1274662 RepID=A0AAV1IEE5_9CHLO|nr:hypothetical protein CVIRNUC_007824 [Coccomyxa viridis]
MHRGKVKAYYAAEGAFYTASVFMLLLWEERRKDFWVMMLHHLVTFALITASYSLSFGVKDVLGYVPQYNIPLSGLLCVLVVLHGYWFSLIARIAWRQITTGEASDSRESDE